jgi:hypothetical protein
MTERPLAHIVPRVPDRLGHVGTDHARNKKTGTVLDRLVITC